MTKRGQHGKNLYLEILQKRQGVIYSQMSPHFACLNRTEVTNIQFVKLADV